MRFLIKSRQSLGLVGPAGRRISISDTNRKMRSSLLLLVLLISVALCDIYMHNPRGSNNRNREKAVNTKNDRRLFDSQNNNKGGYCWGPAMTFYEGSLLQVEWTAQHGCGTDNQNVDCDIILQYICHPDVRDGLVTDTITKDTQTEKDTDPTTGEQVYKYGMHEPYEFFDKCRQRQRNTGLFIADQGIPTNAKATRTRQENNDNPHGFECEEERDYYPYWHPSPWRDIAILTSNTKRCSYFKAHSQNTEGKNFLRFFPLPSLIFLLFFLLIFYLFVS